MDKEEWWLPGAGGRVNWELMVHEYRLSVGEDENILEIDIGDSCK